jgi:uncharacterized protein
MSDERPLPGSDALTAPYWAAANEKRFVLPRCVDCGKHHFYPRARCPHCGSTRIEWAAASGRGTVYTYTVIQRAPSPAFAADVPYVVATIALAEGPHLMSNVTGCAPDAVRIGMPVKVAFRELPGGVMLPVFEPAGD